MGTREILAALRAGWWLPLLGALCGAGAALLVSLTSTPLYVTGIQMFVSGTNTTSTGEALQGSQFTESRITSYAELLTGEELATRVVDELNLDVTPSELAAEISASLVTDTTLINVTVTDPSPARAQDIAESIGDLFPGLVAELETTPSAPAPPVQVTVVDRPELPVVPSTPKTTRNVQLGVLLGLLAGACVAVARTRLDRSVRDPETLGELAGAPVIGIILRDPVLEKRHVFNVTSLSPAAEGYRRLRTNLQFIDVDTPPRTIMVSSAIPGEGKTTLTLNLALALVEAGRQVVVVEGDLRRPRVTRYLDMVSGVGLTNVLAGTAELHEVLQRYRDGGLSVLASGPLPFNPSQLLASTHMKSLMEELLTKNDFVLIDAPPVLPVADATSLAVVADGVLLSVRYGSTRKDLVRRAAATLEQVGARTLGVVLNVVPSRAEVSSGYGYLYDPGPPTRGSRHRPRGEEPGPTPR